MLSNKRKCKGKGREEEEAGFYAKLSKPETRVNLQKPLMNRDLMSARRQKLETEV